METYIGTLENVSKCIRVDQYYQAVSVITQIDTDNTVKIGVLCFIAGMFLVLFFDYLEKWWKK
jgi:hypothetical protein